jgi:D-alanine transaminase
MSRIAYINGRYVPKSHAQVAVEDRGYLFSDGVYDVLPVLGGKLAFAERYLDRLIARWVS